MKPAPAETFPEGTLFDCPVCGVSIRDRVLARGEVLVCGRCQEVVRVPDRGHLMQVAWALATTGLILCLLANLYPILTFDVAGNSQSNHILTGVLALIWMGYWPVALLVFFCAVAAPVLYFAAVWYVAGACCLNVRWPMAGHVARWAEWIEPWSLVPVFAIACVVSVVKLDMLGSVAWDKGIFWIALLAVCSFGLSQVFDREYVAKRLGAGQ